MKFIHRLAFYMVGFIIGLIILFFFLSGKKTSCDYGPNARVLKNIRTKERIVSIEVLKMLNANDLDTSAISNILKNGDVLFSESEKEREPCQIFKIEGNSSDLKNSEKKLKLLVENCDSIANILKVEILPN